MLLNSLKYAEEKGYTVCLVLENSKAYIGEIEISNDSESLVITCDQGKIWTPLNQIKHSSTIIAPQF